MKKQTPTVAKLFYFPFESHSLEAVTESNIERDRIFYIQIVSLHPRYQVQIPDEHPLLTKLKQMLTQTRGSRPLGKASLRLKLKMPNETYLADADGGVRHVETGELFHLSQEQMKEIGRDIEYLAGVVDMLSVQYTDTKQKK